ncbi:MAG: extracellular solute-binding protein [Planctomycetaceae bacterium]
METEGEMNWSFLIRVYTLLPVPVLLMGCGKSESAESDKSVVVYTSVDDVFARPICEEFERETGIKVLLVTDTEETKSTGLLNRLIAEKERSRADVFWSGDPVRAGVLKLKEVSTPYRSAAAKGLPANYSDPDGHWIGFSARARVLIYNKTRLKSEKLKPPQSVSDLADPRFKGKACLANPLFGTTSMHAAALFQVLGDKGARKFFQSLVDNQVTIVSSNGEVRRLVAAGKFAIGLTDTDDAHVAIREGKPIGVVYPDRNGNGTLVVPNAVVLIKGGPHPDAARRFIDYLLRAETEMALAKSAAAQLPLRPDVTPPSDVTPIGDIKAMDVDYARLAEALQKLSRGFLKEWVDQNK